MAKDMNQFNCTGHLGKDPEMSYTSSGKAMCSFSMAVNDYNGNPHWFRVVAWERLAEICGQYLYKGSFLRVTGELTTYKREGDDHRYYQVVARDIQFLTSKADREGSSSQSNYADPPPPSLPDEDIPF
jgi:single-strand DNA-binding protein